MNFRRCGRDWEEEETYFKTSPLTLTRIIKGLKNRGKEKEAEVETEEGDNIEIDRTQFESAA